MEVLVRGESGFTILTNAGDYIFRIYPSDSYDGVFLAEYSYKKLGASTSAILYLQVMSTKQIADIFKKRFEELGGKVLLMEGHNESGTDFRASLIKLNSLSSELST